jgi:hypothetical protein
VALVGKCLAGHPVVVHDLVMPVVDLAGGHDLVVGVVEGQERVVELLVDLGLEVLKHHGFATLTPCLVHRTSPWSWRVAQGCLGWPSRAGARGTVSQSSGLWPNMTRTPPASCLVLWTDAIRPRGWGSCPCRRRSRAVNNSRAIARP